MATLFVHKAILFVPAAYQTQANGLSQSITGNPADAFTFTVPLNASGLSTDAPTYYWTFPALMESAWQTLLADLPMIPGGIYYCLSNPGMLLEATNFPNSSAVIGQPWTPEQALAEMKLQVIQGTGP